MKNSIFALALIGAVAAHPASTSRKREVPQEHSHENIVAAVNTQLQINNPDNIQDAVFGLLGAAAGIKGAGNIKDADCLQQATADQAFTNAKAAGDVAGMTSALIFRALERNTGAVGLASVPCKSITAVNPEIAALQQHQDPAGQGAQALNKQIASELARQIAAIGGDPTLANEASTFAPGTLGDATAAGNTCDDANDKAGCINTLKRRVDDLTAAEITAAIAGTASAGAATNGTVVAGANAGSAANANASSNAGSAANSDAAGNAAACAALNTGSTAAANATAGNAQTGTGNGQAGKKAGKKADKKASKKAGKKAGKKASKAAGKAAGNAQAAAGNATASAGNAQAAAGNGTANAQAATDNAQASGAATGVATDSAAGAASGAATGAASFNGCDPTIKFGTPSDGRQGNAFEATDLETFPHGSALNIAVISGFICSQIGNKCKVGAAAVTTCNNAATAANGLTGQAAADAFNSALKV